MTLQVENAIWHAFDYLAMDSGRQNANKSKLKVNIFIVMNNSYKSFKAISFPLKANPFTVRGLNFGIDRGNMKLSPKHRN